MDRLVMWVVSPVGRVVDGAAGVVLALFGSWWGTIGRPEGFLGFVVALLGVPLIYAALFDVHALVAVLGYPVRGKDVRAMLGDHRSSTQPGSTDSGR